MNDLTVVKANSLIEASYRLTLDEMRLLALTVGTLDPKSNQQIFEFSVSEFVNQFPEMNAEMAYSQIKKAIERIAERWVITEDEKLVTKFRWVSSQTYFKKEGRFKIALTNEIMPYLTQLKGQFTQYQIEHISGFTSVHSIRIYELLTQYKTLGERYISLEDFKKWLQLEDKYNRYNNLKQWVIDPSITEINEKSNLFIEYEPIKQGRKITGIEFRIKFKKSKLTPPKYPPRPQVKAGTHEEGLYFRDCIARFKAWYKENELTLADLSDEVLKQHYKHVRPLGDEWAYKPLLEELQRRGIKAIYNSNAAKVEFK